MKESGGDNPQEEVKEEQKQLTRREALGLNLDKNELLSTGEVRLGNGKIIGHKAFKYIYQQRYHPEETRESVLINKIAVEYRKLVSEGSSNLLQKMITDGTDVDVMTNEKLRKVDQIQKQVWDLNQGLKNNKIEKPYYKIRKVR